MRGYFFLNPFGQVGLTAVTFLVNLPLTQVIVVFLATAGFAVWVATGAATSIVGGASVTTGVGVGVGVATGAGAS